MLVDPKKKECVAELVGPGCAQPEPARAVGLDALIGIVQASCERALTARVAECGEDDSLGSVMGLRENGRAKPAGVRAGAGKEDQN
jgi:hypothetical protein